MTDHQRISLTRGDVLEEVLLDVDAGSWAALSAEGNSCVVRQGGSAHRIWDVTAPRPWSSSPCASTSGHL